MRIVYFLTYTEIEVKMVMWLSLPLALELVIWIGLANGMLADQKKKKKHKPSRINCLPYLPPLTQHKPASLPVQKDERCVKWTLTSSPAWRLAGPEAPPPASSPWQPIDFWATPKHRCFKLRESSVLIHGINVTRFGWENN